VVYCKHPFGGPKEVLRYLAGEHGYRPKYEGSDEEIIRQHLANEGNKVMLPYSYASTLSDLTKRKQ